MRGRQPVSGELAEYISDQEVFEGLFRVALEYADVAAEAEPSEVGRVREKFKYAVWRYVRQWVAGRLKGQTRRVPLVGKSK